MPVAAPLRLLAALGLLCAGLALPAAAQDLPPCAERPTAIHERFYADRNRWCVERVLHAPDIEAYAFTALAVGADGALYATRPLANRVMRISDSDGDGLPDTMEPFVEGVTRPMGLAAHGGDLYIAGGANIYRASHSGEVATLVSGLPTGRGYGSGGLAIGADRRMYIGVGAPCDICDFDGSERGLILSFDLDGGDRQVVARGFRRPADLAFYRGQLWTVDSAPRHGGSDSPDEVNIVRAGGYYGFPDCLNAEFAERDCGESVPPVVAFGRGAVPLSLAAYPQSALPGAGDTLIVILGGEPSQVDIVGYKALMLSFDSDNQPLGATVLAPYSIESRRHAYRPYRGEALVFREFIHINEAGFGFYPQKPLAAAVDGHGAIFISLTGGRIIALRPRDPALIPAHAYPAGSPLQP